MVLRREDYSYLLDNLRDIAYNYYLYYNGDIIGKDGKVKTDERLKTCVKFYMLYCLAYKNMMDMQENNPNKYIDRETIIRALASYDMFNYFINTCVGEYCIYDEIGTGMVTYNPYQPLADFFFEDESRKESLMNYLNSELANVFNNDEVRRVK